MVGVDAPLTVLKVTLSPTASWERVDSPFLSMSLLEVTAYVLPSMVTLLVPTAVTVPLLSRAWPGGAGMPLPAEPVPGVVLLPEEPELPVLGDAAALGLAADAAFDTM